MSGSSASVTTPYTSALATASTRCDARRRAGLEHVERALGVEPQHRDRVGPGGADVGPAGQVVHGVGPGLGDGGRAPRHRR